MWHDEIRATSYVDNSTTKVVAFEFLATNAVGFFASSINFSFGFPPLECNLHSLSKFDYTALPSRRRACAVYLTHRICRLPPARPGPAPPSAVGPAAGKA